jgi:hypothetical protein
MTERSEGEILDELSPESTDATLLDEASAEYVGRWIHLVSTTNWEKGQIISLWRASLIDAEAPVQAYSDEAWARRVGNVTGQHVGRLRRVWEQFGQSHAQYRGLYWSHFQAALDWNDAEMWLEGAVQNGWSVSQMRTQRWEAMGSPSDACPREEEVVAADMDEDANPDDDSAEETVSSSTGTVRDFEEEMAEASESEEESNETMDSVPFDAPDSNSATAIDPVRPFENLPKLPDDLAEAFESFKLAILAHKITGWEEISCGAVLSVLDGLKQLALAPSDTGA